LIPGSNPVFGLNTLAGATRRPLISDYDSIYTKPAGASIPPRA
jgi:hypothetical protein